MTGRESADGTGADSAIGRSSVYFLRRPPRDRTYPPPRFVRGRRHRLAVGETRRGRDDPPELARGGAALPFRFGSYGYRVGYGVAGRHWEAEDTVHRQYRHSRAGGMPAPQTYSLPV